MDSPSSWSAKTVKDLPVEQRLAKSPAFIKSLKDQADQLGLDVKRIYIYGSRARGDHRTNSDYDLAFEIGNSKNWAKFIVENIDDAETLLDIDCVDIKSIGKDLKEKILKEGILLYEQPQRA